MLFRSKTLYQCEAVYSPEYFNPLPPQGKTQRLQLPTPKAGRISIHFPHRGRHPGRRLLPLPSLKFQSTSPTGEDTSLRHMSIFRFPYFNPLPPQGKTRTGSGQAFFEVLFQSTSPTGEDTLPIQRTVPPTVFQSTSPTGEDTQNYNIVHVSDIFQSTSPTGEDTSLPPLL